MPAIKNHGNGGYSRGCRCQVCKDARNEHNRAYRIASREAVKWVRNAHPGMWDRLLDDAYDECGLERNPVGAPRDPNSEWGDSIFDY